MSGQSLRGLESYFPAFEVQGCSNGRAKYGFLETNLDKYSYAVSYISLRTSLLARNKGARVILLKSIQILKCVSKVLGQLSDSRTTYIASVTIVQRAG